MAKSIRVVSNGSSSDTQVRNITAGVPSITNQTIESLGLDEINEKITELQQRTFQQSDTPTTGVSEGDTWYDMSTDTLKVYREYPVGSGSYNWEIVLYSDNDIVDGGTW